jgi:hypothetical protein
MERAGVVMRNPDSHRITVLSRDLETIGEQIDLDPAEALSELGNASGDSEVSLQFWFDAGSDLVVHKRSPTPDRVVLDMSLDGVSADHGRLLVELAVAMAEAGRVDAVVADRIGASDAIDWDGLVCGTPVELGALPDLVVLPAAIAMQYPRLASFESRVTGAHVLIDVTGRFTG